MKTNDVIIVAGLKRSGTSMLMQMLQKGGIETAIDEIRDADLFNPNGYYDHQKLMEVDRKNPKPYAIEFMESLQGKAIKVYAGFLRLLPTAENLKYKVIFIERDIFEVWASRRKMQPELRKKGNDSIIFFAIRQRENLKSIIENVKLWLNSRKDVEVLWLNYKNLVEQPNLEINRICQFLNADANFILNKQAMVSTIDPNLYNEKATQLFLSTDRSPKAVAQLINQYVIGKTYCEIGIGEGHNLNLVSTAKHKFGIERTPYGVKRCKELYPQLEVIQGDFFKVYKSHPFEVCFLWIIYPYCKKFVDAILSHNKNTIVLMGLNYYYHLPDGDEKKQFYMEAYPKEAQADKWNAMIDDHLKELESQGFTYTIEAVTDYNGEIFSVAVIQKRH